MAHITYYLATNSPFTYLSGTRMEAVAAKHGATIEYRPLNAYPLFDRTGGIAAPERHRARRAMREQELRRISRTLGLEMDLDPAYRLFDSERSSYALINAQKVGGGDLGQLVHQFTGAVWRDKRDIMEDSVIAECLTAASFDPAIANLDLPEVSETYARNLEEAIEDDCFGVPFYIVDGKEKFWGQDRIDSLDQFLAGGFSGAN